jgi:hypothetical protein
VRSECSESGIRDAGLSAAGQRPAKRLKFDADFMGISAAFTDGLRRGAWQMLSGDVRFVGGGGREQAKGSRETRRQGQHFTSFFM